MVKEVSKMCYNCGCGMADDDMGHPGVNVINQTFDEMAGESGESSDALKRKVGEMLKNNNLTPEWADRLQKASNVMGQTLEESKKHTLELLQKQGLA